MKQNLLLISLLLTTSIFSAQAEDVTTTIDNIVYTADSEGTTATVAQSKSATGDVIIPETVTIEGKSYTVTELAKQAFMASALKGTTVTSVELPGTVTKIGEKAFNSCTQLKSVNIPEGITELGTNMFNKCESLESIVLPSTLETLGNNAFKGCKELIEIVVPENVTSIGLNCFQNCTKLSSVQLPEGITELGGSLFSGCVALETIEIPASVTKIGDGTFDNTGFKTIALPAGLTELGQAFGNCDLLTSIVIPDGVKEIQGSTFNKCTALESVTFGSEITDINDLAFNQCTAIKNVIVKAVTPPTLDAGAFPQGIFATAKLSVPDASLDAYKAADVWKNFSEIASAIDVIAAGKTVVDSYTITGNKVSENYRGIVIVRYSDGSVAKQFKR